MVTRNLQVSIFYQVMDVHYHLKKEMSLYLRSRRFNKYH